MITITVFGVITIIALVLVWMKDDWVSEKVAHSVMTLVVMAVIGIAVGFPAVRAFEGLMPNYSEGVREGYITKASTKGVIFETNEAQLQVGTGAMAALQEPWAFSVPDHALFAQVNEMLGQKVRVRYSEWLIGPYRLGETSYIATSIEPLEPSDE